MSGPKRDIVDELRVPISRASVVPKVQSILAVTETQAREITVAFDNVVARPLEKNLRNLRGRDLAKRNPMIYTARGVRTVDDWVRRVIEDKETSAIEAHIGTFLEEVARIASGGVKPGNGVDLQMEGDDGVIRLYAIQAAPNTKNAGSRRSDVEALKRAAKPLRAARRHVELAIAVLHGRAKTGEIRSEPGIAVLASDEFWERVSGIPDFRARLFRASIALAELVQSRSTDEVERIRKEAVRLFGGDEGTLNLAALTSTMPVATVPSPPGTESGAE
jgi:hypothetical protein